MSDRFNKDGEPLCPMLHIEHWRDDDDNLQKTLRVCQEPLRLIVSLCGPAEDSVSVRESGRWANTDQWRLECDKGHVVALSDGEENAEDFDAQTILTCLWEGFPTVTPPAATDRPDGSS